ncbi:restriction endonuclease subunit S [Flavobacteriales bacterium]|nr:restriction endonuclease subunit S [Flavobacteriales bacterium]
MEGWKYINLGDIIHIKHGYGFKGKYFVEEPNHSLLLTPGNFAIGGGFKSDKMKYYDGPINDEFVLCAGDVIVTMTDLSMKADTLGYSAKIPNNPENTYLHNQRLGLVSLKTNEFDLDYIYWLLRTYNYQKYIAGSSSGATVKHTSPKKIYSAKLLVPESKVTQKRIADILSSYDDLIENNLKRIKLLEQAAQNIYKEWFVNLRFPGHENTPINEEIGLPEGWGNAELGSVATVQSSKRVFLADYVDIGVPFYRGKEISQKVKHEVISEPYFISHEKFREFDSRFGSPKENDILITAVGTIGNCYLARKSDLPFYFKDGNLLWIHSYNENVSGFYLIQYFQSPIFKEILNSITIGSSQKALTITAVKKLNITVPNNEMLEKFDSIIKPTMNQIEVLAKQNQKLKAARDILLPRLMNRTIEV